MAYKRILDPSTGFKLGLFSSNCSSGMAVTTVEPRMPLAGSAIAFDSAIAMLRKN